jgi:hypothetical protein
MLATRDEVASKLTRRLPISVGRDLRELAHNAHNIYISSASPPKDDIDKGRAPDEADGSRDGSGDMSELKRKYSDREPESPGQLEPETAFTPGRKKERSYYDTDDTHSPASYPTHVIVPTSEKAIDEPYNANYTQSPDDIRTSQVGYSAPEKSASGAQVLTPDSINRQRPSTNYDIQPINYQPPYQDVYRTPSYNPDMDYGRNSYGAPPPPAHGSVSHGTASSGSETFVRNRRWACDICNVATFLSYEEACAHEEICSRRYHEPQPYHEPRHPPPRPPSQGGYGNQRGPIAPQGSGLGALYHASQEVVTPPTPHRHSPQGRWGSSGPPLPVFPHEQNYYRGHYDSREEPSPYYNHHGYHHHHQHPHPPPHKQHHPVPVSNPQYPPAHHPVHHQSPDYYQKRMLLALPGDRESLSDRQCYVRSEMVEIFAATEKDVSARHSKGAQKLVLGQVGIRCVHCSHLRPRDRAERAVCYPSSISRIYQTVADMQRFHFEQCREIPDHVRQIYKKLKTTRPRGVGSPQTYWMSSAKTLNLVDTDDCGIRFENDGLGSKEHISDMSIGTN